MTKLLKRLQDPARSGVYRTSRTDAIEEALRGSRVDYARIALQGASGKEDLLKRIAASLGFPEWFGENWDALEDCLTDLSWRPADGHMLVFEGYSVDDDLGVLIDVLASSAEFWAARGKPFFAAFVDPGRMLGLADLFRES